MNPVAFLFSWYNLPFTLALATGLALALMQLVSGFGDGEAEAVEGIDSATDVGVSGDTDGDAETLGPGGGPLAALGVGQIPLLIVLMALLNSLGALGLLANSLLVSLVDSYPSAAFAPVLLITVVGALPLTRVISGGFARLASRSSTAVSNEDLVGRPGIVVSAAVSQTYGRVAVRDRHGTVHTIFAVIARGEPLPEQSEVAVLAYDQGQRRFIVRPLRSP
jgi:membrane protein implicated in regulation of membrane protease activity